MDNETLLCLDDARDGSASDCRGEVQMRESLSGTGMRIARCDRHWTKRLEFQQDLNARYPQMPPPDFDPMYAGERWDEDY